MQLSNLRQHVVGTKSHNIDEGKGEGYMTGRMRW
jgi:hypothetical protein